MKEFETDQEEFKLSRKHKIKQDYDKDYAYKQDKYAKKRRRRVEPYKRKKIDPNDFLDDDYNEYME